MAHAHQSRHPPGIPGQLSSYVQDKDSSITSFGKHNRLIVFGDYGNGEIELREDFIGLSYATEEDRLRVANETFQRMHPQGSQLVFLGTEEGYDGKTRWHRYRIVRLAHVTH